MESSDIILSTQQTTKALIRLRGCAGWSASLLFAYDIRHIFSWPGSYAFRACVCLFCVRYTRAASWQNQQKTVRPAKTQISPVWSESSLSAWRKLRSLATQWAHSEDFDQTGRMPMLIWVFAGRKFHCVGFVMRRLILFFFLLVSWVGCGLWFWRFLNFPLTCVQQFPWHLLNLGQDWIQQRLIWIHTTS